MRTGRREEMMSELDLRERKRFDWAFFAIAVVVSLTTFLKGFRMPNAWAATHFAFNYSQGFVRRRWKLFS